LHRHYEFFLRHHENSDSVPLYLRPCSSSFVKQSKRLSTVSSRR
jgi:hypothetical protein